MIKPEKNHPTLESHKIQHFQNVFRSAKMKLKVVNIKLFIVNKNLITIKKSLNLLKATEKRFS